MFSHPTTRRGRLLKSMWMHPALWDNASTRSRKVMYFGSIASAIMIQICIKLQQQRIAELEARLDNNDDLFWEGVAAGQTLRAA